MIIPLVAIANLGIIFAACKLFGLLAWPWYLIMSPFYAFLGLVLLGCILDDKRSKAQAEHGRHGRTFRVLNTP